MILKNLNINLKEEDKRENTTRKIRNSVRKMNKIGDMTTKRKIKVNLIRNTTKRMTNNQSIISSLSQTLQAKDTLSLST